MKLICGKYVGVGSVQYACSYTDVNDWSQIFTALHFSVSL